MKAYDINELREQFNQPVDGFYVMDSKLIHGSIKEDFDREKSDPAFSGDSSEAEPEAPGVYYFTLEDIRMQGSSYDALIKVDATGYMSGNLTSEAGSADDGKAHHDLALNGSNIAMPGSVNKGGSGAKKDGSYLQKDAMNQELLTKIRTEYSLSETAVHAKENAASNGAAKKVEFAAGNLFEAVKKRAKFDMIISNPPYIRSDIIPTLQQEVKDYEPALALDGGEDGLDFYRTIIETAPAHLEKNGILVLEIGHDQAVEISRLIEKTEAFSKVEIIRDYGGNNRVVMALKA